MSSDRRVIAMGNPLSPIAGYHFHGVHWSSDSIAVNVTDVWVRLYRMTSFLYPKTHLKPFWRQLDSVSPNIQVCRLKNRSRGPCLSLIPKFSQTAKAFYWSTLVIRKPYHMSATMITVSVECTPEYRNQHVPKMRYAVAIFDATTAPYLVNWSFRIVIRMKMVARSNGLQITTSFVRPISSARKDTETNGQSHIYFYRIP